MQACVRDSGNGPVEWRPLCAASVAHGPERVPMRLIALGVNHQTAPVALRERVGQVKQPWPDARAAGTLGPRLDRLFQHAFATAKRARTDTRIGANPVSVASAAVRLAQDSFARLEDSTVLLVGAGDTIELAARHLVQARVQRLLVANRTTASQRPVIEQAHVARALAGRRHRPMLLIDLAVPRDIAPDVAALRDVFVYTVDDLERSVEDNRRSRQQAALEAEAIIDLQVSRYVEAAGVAARIDPVRQLRAHGEAARDEVLHKARAQLASGHSPEAVLGFIAHALTNRLLHAPTVALRDAAATGDTELARAAQRLYGQDAMDPRVDPDRK